MLALGLLLAHQAQTPDAFRAVFEDRPRQLIIRFAPETYLVFSPDVCAVRKIWRGGVEFKGKVYDFSQDNSSARGQTLFEVPSAVMDGGAVRPIPPASNVWSFNKAGETIASEPFPIGAWGPVYLAFEERGDTGRFRVTLRREGQDAYEYLSSNTVLGPTAWQWNYKQIPHDMNDPTGRYTLHFTCGEIKARKDIQKIRMFGDRWAWFDDKFQPLPVRFLGYRKFKGVTKVQFRVGTAQVSLTPYLGSKGVGLNYDVETSQPLIHLLYQNGGGPVTAQPSQPSSLRITYARIEKSGNYLFEGGAQ